MRRYVRWLLVLCLSAIAAPAVWAAPQGPRGQQPSASEPSARESAPKKPSPEKKPAQDKPAGEKGWLGVEAKNLTPEEIAGAGGAGPLQEVKVVRIAEGSPALGGLTQGDVLVSLDGREIDSVKTFFGILSGKAPGKEIKLGVSRAGKKRVVALKLGLRPGDKSAAKPAAPAPSETPPAQASASQASASKESVSGRVEIPGVAFMSAGAEETSQSAAGQEAAAPEAVEPPPQSQPEEGSAPPASASASGDAQDAQPKETADAQSVPAMPAAENEGAASQTALASGAGQTTAADAGSAPASAPEPGQAPSLDAAAAEGGSQAGAGDERKIAANDFDVTPPSFQPAGRSGAPSAKTPDDAFRLAAREPQRTPTQADACAGLLLNVGSGVPGEQQCVIPGAGKTLGQSFRDCPTCPEMVVVPPGTFVMGSPRDEVGDKSSGEPEHNKREDPQHLVTIPYAFAVGKFSVTFEEWDACQADGACGDTPPSDKGWGRGRRPVINVSWANAKAYVKWLSQKTGKDYRLLSESEREYVARAGSTSAYWWGATATTDKANFSYDQNVSGEHRFENEPGGKYRDQTLVVDDLQPNPWGLHHVHGNVAEWVEDCWHDNYKNKPEELKKTGAAWKVGDCFYRIKRGGSYDSLRLYLRAAHRGFDEFDNKEANTGFRVARNLAP